MTRDLWIRRGVGHYTEATDDELADMGLVSKGLFDERYAEINRLRDHLINAGGRIGRLEFELEEWVCHGRKVTQNCPRCGGFGYADVYEPVTVGFPERKICADCNGTGKVPAEGVTGRYWWCAREERFYVKRYQACTEHEGEWVYVLPDPTQETE